MQRAHKRPSNVVIQNGMLHDTNQDKIAAEKNQLFIDKQVKLSSGATYTVCKPAFAAALEAESSDV